MKKLLLSISFLVVYVSGNAQTITAGTMYAGYADITPDTLMNYVVAPYTHEVYDFSAFAYPSDNIEFTAHGAISSGGSAAYISVTPLQPTLFISQGRVDSVFVPATGLWNITTVAKVLNAGDAINSPGAVWGYTQEFLTDHSGSGGGNKDVNDFIGGEHFIGLKYENGPVTQYGWIRVECVSEDSCYVKDYSWSTPVSGVAELSTASLNVWPNPAEEIFYVEGLDPNSFVSSKLKLTDICGKNVPFVTGISGSRIRVSLPESPAGCYFLSYQSEEKNISVKILKSNH